MFILCVGVLQPFVLYPLVSFCLLFCKYLCPGTVLIGPCKPRCNFLFGGGGGGGAHCVVVRLLRVIIVCSLKRLTHFKEETVWNFGPVDCY